MIGFDILPLPTGEALPHKRKPLVFSVQPRWPLCLCGELTARKTHHRDTENTKGAQRRSRQPTFEASPPAEGWAEVQTSNIVYRLSRAHGLHCPPLERTNVYRDCYKHLAPLARNFFPSLDCVEFRVSFENFRKSPRKSLKNRRKSRAQALHWQVVHRLCDSIPNHPSTNYDDEPYEIIQARSRPSAFSFDHGFRGFFCGVGIDGRASPDLRRSLPAFREREEPDDCDSRLAGSARKNSGGNAG